VTTAATSVPPYVVRQVIDERARPWSRSFAAGVSV
jgi:hypothetical protein